MRCIESKLSLDIVSRMVICNEVRVLIYIKSNVSMGVYMVSCIGSRLARYIEVGGQYKTMAADEYMYTKRKM